MAYIDVPFEVDFQTLVDRALDRIREQLPGWQPREGHLEVAVLEELTRLTIESRSVAAQVPGAIFSAYGQKVVGITQIAGKQATGTARFTLIDDAGYNIPAGTLLSWRVSGYERIYFLTDTTLTIPAGSLTGDVTVTAEHVGTHANELGPGDLTLVDQFTVVDSVALVDTTSGGVDAESDEAYRDRLADELALQAPRPILPGDFAVLARRTAGVHRALALDGYRPAYNRLTANQASLETDAAGWNAGPNTAIARDTAQALDGSASLRLDDTTADAAAGDITAYTDGGLSGAPARGGQDYTALASLRDAGTARNIFASLEFYDDAGTFLARSDGASVAQTLGVFTQASVTAAAPVGTAHARLRVTVQAVADGESHYLDAASLHEGAHTDWHPGGGDGFGHPRMTTLVPIDTQGQPVSQTVVDALAADMEDRREINFIVHTGQPTYTPVHVNATVRRHTDVLPDTAQERCEAAVVEFLSPASWAGGGDSPPTWRYETTVRYLELASVLSEVAGVSYVEALTINGVETDLVLDGVAPLPARFDDPADPSTVAITVTP